MAKRPNQTGSVYARKDGRWCATITLAGGRRVVKYAPTRREARALLVALTTQSARIAPPSRMTLADFSTQWLSTIAPNVRPTTRDNYAVWLRRYVLPTLGPVRLDRLQPLHIAALYADLQRRGLSARTIHCAHKVLRRCLADAARWGIIASNPAASVQPPRLEQHEPPVWGLPHARRFLAYLEERADHWAAFWALVLLGGLRPGEALGADWADLDAPTGTLHVRRTATWSHGTLHVGPPKSAAGARLVALPDAALRVLAAWRRRQAAWRLRAGGTWPDRIVTNCDGRTPAETPMRAALTRACKRLDLPRLWPHALRHGHATLAVALGADIKTLQGRLGHSSPLMTLGVYAHRLPDADRALADALDAALGG